MSNKKYCEPEGNTFSTGEKSQETDTFDGLKFPRKQLFCRMSSTAGLPTTEQTRRVLTRAGGTSDRIVSANTINKS